MKRRLVAIGALLVVVGAFVAWERRAAELDRSRLDDMQQRALPMLRPRLDEFVRAIEGFHTEHGRYPDRPELSALTGCAIPCPTEVPDFDHISYWRNDLVDPPIGLAACRQYGSKQGCISYPAKWVHRYQGVETRVTCESSNSRLVDPYCMTLADPPPT